MTIKNLDNFLEQPEHINNKQKYNNLYNKSLKKWTSTLLVFEISSGASTTHPTPPRFPHPNHIAVYNIWEVHKKCYYSK